jgi:hypothetical protein
MEESKSSLYIPMWIIGLLLMILNLIGGCKSFTTQVVCEEEPFVHTCPQKGHGNCPICFDTILQNEEVVVLDQ